MNNRNCEWCNKLINDNVNISSFFKEYDESKHFCSDKCLHEFTINKNLIPCNNHGRTVEEQDEYDSIKLQRSFEAQHEKQERDKEIRQQKIIEKKKRNASNSLHLSDENIIIYEDIVGEIRPKKTYNIWLEKCLRKNKLNEITEDKDLDFDLEAITNIVSKNYVEFIKDNALQSKLISFAGFDINKIFIHFLYSETDDVCYFKLDKKDAELFDDRIASCHNEIIKQNNISNQRYLKDDLFFEAGKLIIEFQQGSASFLQRKLKIEYNRAEVLITQLEYNAVIGSIQGSKPREVLMKNINELEKLK